MNTDSNWQPAASLEMLRERANLLQQIRDYFLDHKLLEVETPLLSTHGTTDPAVESFNCRYSGPLLGERQQLYLHTSPEFPMKRLLAAGSSSIYQICRVFRQGEFGRFHNPEFTLLEWYRLGFDHHQLMDDVSALIGTIVPDIKQTRLSYRALFERFVGIDPHSASVAQLQNVASERGVSGIEQLQLSSVDGWLDLLLTHVIEPQMPDGLCFIYDYPESQASLSRVRKGAPSVAERFELYLDGVEVANGFHELTDGVEQGRRFEAENQSRKDLGLDPVPQDHFLLQAMAQGLPACAGVALGIDRLLMWKVGAKSLQEVISFPLDRA